jgi:hypothetical protein
MEEVRRKKPFKMVFTLKEFQVQGGEESLQS